MPIRIVDARTEEAKDKGRAKKALRQIDSALDDLTTNWDGLTQAAKLQALRQGLILALRVVKWQNRI